MKHQRREILQMVPLAIGASMMFSGKAIEGEHNPESQKDASSDREKVTGIGGFFFRAQDPAALAKWYQQNLGIQTTPTSDNQQVWRQEAGATAFTPFPEKTKYFGDPSKMWMINFRVRDIAAGGQGAPLVPYVDYLLFRHPRRTRIALNIGGIGNITVIPAGAAPGDVTAFDTGPGNMVIDALAREFTRGKSNCDRGGKIAASGKVATALLDDLLHNSYYRRRPPKSAGREQYGAEFVAGLKATGLPLRDLITTVTVLTAATIAIGVRPWVAGATDLIASGGGVHNPQIMAHLAGFLPCVDISTSSDHGINADAKEAIAFAVLAHETWRRKPSNLPSATGAKHGVVLGTITP